MNKTININLANTFFHIDEDAYNKLQRYLEAIRRSLANSQGKDEIIADIEARIAELFSEKMQHERQVITFKEVDEVISTMGQPEDYLVDEEIFDDAPKQKTYTQATKSKKLYRDIDDKYISGVSSGLGHYLGIDAVWVRLLWILLAFASGGTFIFVYLLFWILVPEAATTAQKLSMKGQPVNISNIEKKIKESFDDVAERVKKVDYDKVKSNSKSFFDSLGEIILLLLKVFGKFIGIILLIIASTVLLSLFISLFTAGTIDILDTGHGWQNYVNIATDIPIWVMSILLFFAIGVPFFFLFYLGLKILVTNLKSIGNVAKFSLLGLWILSIIGLIVLGIKTATDRAYNGYTSEKNELYTTPADTLTIIMNKDEYYDNVFYGNDLEVVVDENDNKKIYSEKIHFNLKKSTDSIPYLKIDKRAKGNSYEDAKQNARAIEYNYSSTQNLLKFDNYLLTDIENKFKDQQIDIDIYIPANQVIYLDETTKYNLGYRTENDKGYYRTNMVNHYWKMGEDSVLKCLDCEDENDPDSEDNTNTNENDPEETNRINIGENGIDINVKNEEGNEFKMKIDEDGVKIKTK
ncbi:PspC domain-containing protein [Abyssalbus ytuae]|uniref:PspC domain-containing protein n=1 Tax=Abyssalbus ytuae TaxID=2926907 RepID=A0A9E7D3N9_9FLAO|nr:PspC domain-containing protein [Abyssalbus ytuae]UOB18054.1 PspC domain-containing protein [Abyssalbus ytuae]